MKKIGVLTLMLLMLAASMCNWTDIKHNGGVHVQNYRQFIQACEAYQIIGEGTDFLTIQCDLPQPLPLGYHIYPVVIDENGAPLRKVSSFAYDPDFGDRNNKWFYFFLYAPGGNYPLPLQSRYIKFVMTHDSIIVSESSTKNIKRWGRRGEVKIFDLPAPPDEINGYLILKDYTFLAKGDFRKPEGYYLEGKVIGNGGRWFQFVPASEILGSETDDKQMSFPTDKGWLELSAGKTHSMQESVSPVAPYVEGWWDGKGYFHPQPLKVVGLKNHFD